MTETYGEMQDRHREEEVEWIDLEREAEEQKDEAQLLVEEVREGQRLWEEERRRQEENR